MNHVPATSSHVVTIQWLSSRSGERLPCTNTWAERRWLVKEMEMSVTCLKKQNAVKKIFDKVAWKRRKCGVALCLIIKKGRLAWLWCFNRVKWNSRLLLWPQAWDFVCMFSPNIPTNPSFCRRHDDECPHYLVTGWKTAAFRTGDPSAGVPLGGCITVHSSPVCLKFYELCYFVYCCNQ